MSEENPVFKVTDRRLFNADGSPRETEPESQSESKKAPSSEPTAQAATADPPPVAETKSAHEREEPMENRAQVDSEASGLGTASEEPTAEEDFADADIPGANDPASFINFMMSIAQNAAASLGMMENPMSHERSVDLELGKHWIDVLGMLEKKTHGNLVPQEQRILEGLLADLRMQFVSLNSAPQSKSARGFSGSDITGGK